MNIDDILTNPKTCELHLSDGEIFSIYHELLNATTMENISTVMEFVHRLPIENAMLFVKVLVHKNNKLATSEPMGVWCSKHKDAIAFIANYKGTHQ